jgi:hypothetical protein
MTRFHHEHIVLILKHKITSSLVMSSVRKYQTPLSSILKCCWLIGVNEGNENYKSLITLKHVSHVALTFVIIFTFH